MDERSYGSEKREKLDVISMKIKERKIALKDLQVQYDVDIKLFGKDDANALVSKQMLDYEEHKIHELEQEVKETTEWISGARACIEHEAYMDVPSDVFTFCKEEAFTDAKK